MAKGKKKKSGSKQDEPGTSGQSPQEEAGDGGEAAGGSESSESHPLSKKDKRAAKKAMAKQQQAVAGQTTQDKPPSDTSPPSAPITPSSQGPETALGQMGVGGPSLQQRPPEQQMVSETEIQNVAQAVGSLEISESSAMSKKDKRALKKTLKQAGGGDTAMEMPPGSAPIPPEQTVPPQMSGDDPSFPALGQPGGRGLGRGRVDPAAGRGFGRGVGRGAGRSAPLPSPGVRGPSPPQQQQDFPALGQVGARGPSPPQQGPPPQGPPPQGPPTQGPPTQGPPTQGPPQQQRLPTSGTGAVPKIPSGQSPPEAAPPGPQKGVEEITERVGTVSQLNIPVRRDLNIGGTLGRRTVVETNHLAVNLSRLKNRTCYHYDVSIDPDKPKRLLRKAVEAFRLQKFPKRYPAFDGRKNLVASSPLFPEERPMHGEVAVLDDERNQTMMFKISVKCVDKVDLKSLESYMVKGANLDIPQKAIQMLDIVIRSAPINRFVQVGRSFFTPPEGVVPLGNGMHMWLGFYQSVTLGWKTFLNIDVAHKGFPAPKNVAEIMHEVLDSPRDPYDPRKDLSKFQQEDITSFLKGLKVEYKLPNQPGTKRTYRVNSVQPAANKLEFKLDSGEKITVQKYFQREKNYDLRHPDMPCLHVGSPKRSNPILLPVELCTILPGQVTFRKLNETQTAEMIKCAATSTEERKKKIQKAIRDANFNQNECVQEFGLSISDRFEDVNARVLDPPRIAYKQKPALPSRGVWRAESFLKGMELRTWCMVNNGVRNIRDDQMRNFAAEMNKVGKRHGMLIHPPTRIYSIDSREQGKLMDIFQECKNNKAELVVVLIPDKGDVYAKVKQFAELKVGVLTQCLRPKTVFRCDMATVSNVLLKINSKLNGVNHKLSSEIRPACLNRPAMIIGADVTHPSPDQKNIPSVAAVCASHDPDAFQYNLQYRLQEPRTEIIKDLKEIMRQQLIFFHQRTKCKPERLIFYRDGVSEGQFGQVLNAEVRAIQQACQSLNPNYKPLITFLVVQKRHHTRFFPKRKEDEDGRNKNVPPGTIVDTTITHPSHIDFYLVSHASIQGVSRPTKYRKLWDDANMSVDEVEQLTYYLCHLFSRCTRSVSYPAPTYYAHLAAYRARVYIDNRAIINLDNLSREQAIRAIKDEIQKDFPMFFV